MATKHDWHIEDPHFDNILNGKKIYETRVNDEKRQLVKLGDIIEWTHRTENRQPYSIVVIGIDYFKSFKDAIETSGVKKVLPNVSTVEEGVKLYEAFPHKTGTFKDGAKKYGVVRFHLHLNNNQNTHNIPIQNPKDCPTFDMIKSGIKTVEGRKFSLKKNGIHLVGVLPSSQIYLAQNFPIVFTTEGMYYVSCDVLNDIGIYGQRDFSFLPYTEIGELDIDEKSLKYSDKIIIKGPSNLYLRTLLKFLHQLNSIAPNERTLTIGKYLSKRYNIDEVISIKKDSAPHLLNLYISTFVLFLLIFIITPLTIYSDFYLYTNLNILVAFIFIVYLFILFLVAKLNKKLFHPEKGIRTLNFFAFIFSPINTIHASIYLTKNLYHS